MHLDDSKSTDSVAFRLEIEKNENDLVDYFGTEQENSSSLVPLPLPLVQPVNGRATTKDQIQPARLLRINSRAIDGGVETERGAKRRQQLLLFFSWSNLQTNDGDDESTL